MNDWPWLLIVLFAIITAAVFALIVAVMLLWYRWRPQDFEGDFDYGK